MRKLNLMLITLFLLTAGVAVAVDVGLQPVDTDPLPQQELDLNGTITVFFDRELDCDTVAAAASIEPAVAGTFDCADDARAVTFTPQADYEPGKMYTVTFSTDLTAADGSALADPASFDFVTLGSLEVVEVLPGDEATDIATEAMLTVIFNRPVVSLGVPSDDIDLPQPLTFSPETTGQGEWLNTSIYTFRPDPSWVPGETYTVTVDAGLQAADGAQLQEPFSWSFTVEQPRLVETNPADATTGVRLEPRLQAVFNVPLDRASLEAAFTVIADGATDSVPGDFEWSDDSTGFAFVPSEQLQLDTVYDIGFAADSVFDVTGQAALPETSWSIATVPFPAVIRTQPLDGSTDVDPMTRTMIYFASPMERESITSRVVIDPEPWREPEFFYQDWDDSIAISFPTEPSTDYTITLEAGAADVYGNAIDEDFTFSFSTAPYSPDVELRVPGSVGFYDANRETTGLFVTHRNVSRLDLELYSIELQEFIGRYQDSWDPIQDYIPNPENQLRAWQIESVAPENARRYELLNLAGGGSSGSAVVCPGAPESRVKVGDSVIVISDPDPVRARSAPLDGEIIDLLYRDYTMPVIGGPVCAGDLLWWEVELRNGQRAWVAEGLDDEYFIEVRVAGQQTEIQIPQEFADGDALSPGIYYLRVGAPEIERTQYSHQHFLVVGDTSLTVKTGLDSALVWATDVASGQPVAGAPIVIYDTSNQMIGEGVTDADGVASMDIPPLADLETAVVAVLDDGDRFGMGVNLWSNGVEPWRFNLPFAYYPQQYRVYIYTDRPVYRPDQPVYFRGVVRLKDDVDYLPADMETVPVTITDDRGSAIYEQELPLTEFGTFSGEFTLAADAPLGYYRLAVELPSEHRWQSDGGSTYFNVAQYRLPEFQIELEPEATEVVQDETIRVDLEARYFFGGPVSEANVEYNVIANPHFFNYTGSDGYYDFADMNGDDPDAGYDSTIASGTGVTDAQGRLTIEVPADLRDSILSQRFTIEVVVTDESEQAVSSRVGVVVHRGEVYIGARPAEYVGTAGRDTGLEFIAVDWDSQPIAGQDIDIEIVERRWSSVQEEDPGGRTVWVWDVEEIPVTTAEVTTGDDGKASYIFIPPAGGIYKITASSRDSAGNEVRSATTLWVSSGEYVTWRQENSNRIDLIADAQSYDIGDTAQILITSPFQGEVEALITVERAGVLQFERVTLDSNSYVYELPIGEAFAPNVFVSVMLVKGVDDTNPIAAFRMGMIQLQVDNSRRQITVEITPDQEQAGPGDTISYTVRTTDYEGNPVQAELGVALTDLAALSLAEPNTGPILDFFYGLQELAMRTASPLTISTDQLTQTVLDTIKGGGGGGGFDGGIFDIREEFLDTAFWEGAVVTDEDGEATFSVTLPDNLTTWRLDVRGVTAAADMLVGQETYDIVSTRPLLIRPVTPRFFVVDDELVLGAVVNNNTGSAQSVEVAVEGTGVIFQGDTVQTAVIPAGGRQRIDWPVIVSDVDAVDLTFYVASEDGEYADASKPPLGQGDERLLPVYRYEAPDIAGTGGVLRSADSVTESIVLPQRYDVSQGELTVNLDPSLAAASIDALRVLERYPYESIEATISRFLPNAMTYRTLQKLEVPDDDGMLAALDAQVQFAIQRLYAQQKADGGWGWFVQDDSNPLVTAYALIGLATARENGFAVDDAVIAQAQDFLESEFRAITPQMPGWGIDRQVFMLHALAYSGSPDVARMDQHYDSRERLSIYAKALLASAFDMAAASGEGDTRADTLLSDIVNDAITSANGVHWEETGRDFWNWNTNTRTTSMVLQTLIRMNPESELIPNVVRWLMIARSADSWQTTQETAWAVMALADWMLVSGDLNPVYDYGLTFNDELLAQAQVSPATATESQQQIVDVAQMLRDETNRLTVTRGEGEGNLYYTAYLRLFLPVSEIEPINSGVVIERHYTLLNDPDRDPITEARVGDVVQVRLTIIAPSSLHYVVVEDPLPAGAEGIDPNLETSQQIGTRPGLDASDPLSRGWGWWWFSNIEFRDEKVVLHSSYLPAGTYEYVYTIRPGIEGTFNVMPPTVRETYFPDVFGRGAGSIFTILPAEE